MQYFGGKARHAKWLAEHVLPISNGRRLIEPFCGGLSATAELKPQVASDVSQSLISLYTAVRGGWVPPETVSNSTYIEIKSIRNPHDPMTAFCGFGCSFGGKWFGGYARGKEGRSFPVGGSYAQTSSRSVIKRVSAIPDTALLCSSYDKLDILPGDVIYCDPPYNETSHGYDCPKWNADRFWQWVLACRDLGATVLISEFSAPEGVEILAEKRAVSNMEGQRTRQSVERLYRVG